MTMEIETLEMEQRFWSGTEGIQYTLRNDLPGLVEKRRKFWLPFIEKYGITSVFEPGCGDAKNLQAIPLPPTSCYGADINGTAVDMARKKTGLSKNILYGGIYELPLKEGAFDCVFTCGFLIHIPPNALDKLVLYLLGLTRKYFLVIEYESKKIIPLEYCGQIALWKRPYYETIKHIATNAGIKLSFREYYFLTKEYGFDNCVGWLFEHAPNKVSDNKIRWNKIYNFTAYNPPTLRVLK